MNKSLSLSLYEIMESLEEELEEERFAKKRTLSFSNERRSRGGGKERWKER